MSPTTIRLLAASALLHFILHSPQVSAQGAPQVQLGNVTVGGRSQEQIEFFGGIPFAAPPTGPLRFQPPQPATVSGAAYDATNYRAACVQPETPEMKRGNQTFGEDCLYLNIMRPTGTNATANYPVMAWIHGGAFTVGWPSQYNGAQLVQRSVTRGTPVIFVSIAYRLGALGFPTGNEAVAKGALNLGHKDQLAALQWVKANIASFGGDPSKVTVFGESGGSNSATNLFLNNNIKDLARAAIFQSGFPIAGQPALYDGYWKYMVGQIPDCKDVANGTDTFTCLRGLSAEAVIAYQGYLTILGIVLGPQVDGPGGLIPDSVSKLIAAGNFAKKPMMAGTVLDEGTQFTTTVNTDDGVRALVQTAAIGLAGNQTAQTSFADRVLQLYPNDPAQGSPFGTGSNLFGRTAAWKRAAAILGDYLFQSVRREWTQAAAKNNVPLFAYYFTDPQTGTLGVTHTSELPYLFGPTAVVYTPSPPAALDALMPKMQDYWISFATSLNPNDDFNTKQSLTKWDQYTTGSQNLLQINNANITMIPDNYRTPQINFLLANAAAFGR